MTRLTRGMMLVLTLAGRSVLGQGPAEFKANVKMVDASDWSNLTGMMYFGGAKTRTELTKDGQAMVVIADPVAKSQMILMPDDKMYMQMPMGQGPVNVSISGPSDPTNPCSGGSGATDCVKGETESVNGHRAVRWDSPAKKAFDSCLGIAHTAISSEDRRRQRRENGTEQHCRWSAACESVHRSRWVHENGFRRNGCDGRKGPGPRTIGRRRRSHRCGHGRPVPKLREAAAKAMRGAGPTTAAAPAGTTGSPWEKAKGWILNLTIEGTAPPDQQGSNRKHDKYSAKYVASVPLNLVKSRRRCSGNSRTDLATCDRSGRFPWKYAPCPSR